MAFEVSGPLPVGTPLYCLYTSLSSGFL